MNGRQKIEAALLPGGSGEVAAVICYEGIFIRDHWRELTDCPWWYQVEPDIDRQLAWRRDAILRTGQDWLALPYCLPREERAEVSLELGSSGVSLVDRRTGARSAISEPRIGGWTVSEGSQSVRPARPAASFSEVDALVPLPSAAADPRVDGRADLAARLVAEFPWLYPIVHVGSPLWLCYNLWGFEGLMTLVAESPELVAHACERFLVRALDHVRQGAYLGAAGIWIEECMTDAIGPAAFERLNLPYLLPIVEEIRRRGMRSIYYYCGNPADRWDLLLAADADALSLEESKKGWRIDIADVVARLRGRRAVLGNLDAIGLLANGSDDRLRVEIARQIEAGRRNGGRFVMSLGSPVTPGTSVERVRRYCDLVHELGSL